MSTGSINGPIYRPGKKSPFTLIRSKSSSSPSSSPISFQQAPSSFQEHSDLEDLDILYELTENRDRYYAVQSESSSISMKSYADILNINIERVRGHLTSPPGRNPIIALCIRFAVPHLFKDDTIKELIALHGRIKVLDRNLPPEINTFLFNFISNFTVSVPKGGRYNAIVPREYHNMLSGLAGEIGVTISNLASICIMLVLMDQETTNKGNAKAMKEYVNSFMLGARARAKAGHALLSVYGL